MEDPTRRERHDFNLASRKAEEAGLRRFQATHWLDFMVGPLGISSQPTEEEFISCLRNGLLLCNLINKIQPGSVSKVVESHLPSQPLTWDSQPLPAFQYFENIRNFLVAVEELKLPAFEASVFERGNSDVVSSTKVVDCILALKAYHEWKQMTGGNGLYKPPRSPLFIDSARRINGRNPVGPIFDSCRKLDMSMSANRNVQQRTITETKTLEDTIVKTLAENMIDAKENMDDNILASFRSGNMDPMDIFSKILASCLNEKQNKSPQVISGSLDPLRESNNSPDLFSTPSESLSSKSNNKCCRACLTKNKCHHLDLINVQERELSNLKELLLSTRKEFENLQFYIQSDLKQLESQVQEMASAALGYHKVVKENRTLYNMVQDLKGNIRVFCRVRPALDSPVKNVIDFIGEDGSLVILDPLKPNKDGRKVFQFNHIFGQSATQDEVFRETQPLIRSVMDGYNVCIFAYGQTGSGKTYTMCGPSGGSSNEWGINYLALDYLFKLTEKRKDLIKYKIEVQMVEIYNEQVHDLLAQDSSVKLEIRSCTNDSIVLPNATMHLVKCTSDVLNLMKLGELNRSVGSTALNNRSSRSHSVLTVHVCGEEASGSLFRSCLNLVDLAGSERVDKSEVTGEGLKEAQYINKSLSCLGDVITALAQKNSHIPYRNSKLTLLLQNSLGGCAKTLMLAHVGPEADSFGETISTLKFAQRASCVELGAAHSNKESNEVLELKAQIESLKKCLASKEGQTPISSKVKTPCRMRRLSIESGSVVKINFDQKKDVKVITPCVQPRLKRMSLEGTYQQTSGGLKMDPRSPIRTGLKSRVVNIPMTPEPLAPSRSEVSAGSGFRTPGVTASTNGKASSQIRKSLRTIGKLLNGSEKRNQQKVGEVKSPLNGKASSNIYEVKSPRPNRRQSLVNIQPPEVSRRTSLGGISNESRSSKTPPMVRASGKLTNRWM